MRTAVVLFTRDLRVHDQPALATACATAEQVVPLFVLDPRLAGRSANRDRFLHQSLADLRATLRGLGGDLLIRRGDPVTETIRLAREVDADGVTVSADVSHYARDRQRRLRDECDRHRVAYRAFPGLTVVDPGALTPTNGDHYKVFTPYFRAWAGADWRTGCAAPDRIRLPGGPAVGRLPALPDGESPQAAAGGETAGRRRLHDWLADLDRYGDSRLDRYGDSHDDLAGDATSRLSPYLRFGCLSPLEVATAAGDRAGPFVRQLCWRDFHYQVANAFPDLATTAYRRGAAEQWRYDADALDAWQTGRTGVPIVDAGMRQLRAQGWMHNRARLITAGYLTKELGLDWRDGLSWFGRWLLDGDLPNNSGNWQWVAGTGNDTRPHRGFNPLRQAHRFDPAGEYVRRWVPELAGVTGAAVHEPWRLPLAVRAGLDYPPPLSDR
ncbi:MULTISPECIES: deoxyribodipyrimidine photo-lyase [unclassified Solwaraspora]|uniref:cryptochrome/photolyase family protein n=1 Tax=unclassified Solwaraspora TaxID=2627926 RepID=UPI00248B8F9E|nr:MULTISPECIES: deoxyribodipyrimidine photo-lyase [unclassified Solwaraspora]WBB96770.1 deoxyribodipyrimidine photo-lyase [Solwaraspora sp. WMMA2059]WBC19326.1 deoxyribodipyrimidine photo-lyase [Solwaraspora sp. WMMA2080]WJK33231.1 deoxyribodipyrimidine photo-lyase [Solwaraspora sp. WMMA2065]